MRTGVRDQGSGIRDRTPHRACPGGKGFGNYRAGVRPRGSSPALAPLRATKEEEKAEINRRTPKGRRGVSLMEVLISTFVLSVGLLGLAALLPLGRFAVVETNKADYSGACGRAAMREVQIRRMLFSGHWDRNPGNGAFAIDPLGVTEGLGDLGGVLPRVNLVVPATGNAYTTSQAEAVFLWDDDMTFTIPENARTYRKFYQDASGSMDGAAPTQWPVFDGQYSWLITASPAATETGLDALSRRLYNVSAVVCYGRDFVGEQRATASFVGGVGLGGGTITVDSGLEVEEGEWLLLCNAAVAKWYRVVSVGQSPATRITLQGPDWDTTNYPQPTAVVIPTVLGVYSTVVELDNDPLWSY